MDFSKGAALWVTLFVILQTIGVILLTYFMGGYSHAVPQ
jgi:hypothetical protein